MVEPKHVAYFDLYSFQRTFSVKYICSDFTWEKTTHHPVAGFTKDPFLIEHTGGKLPNIITQATLDFFYKD